MVHQCSLSYNDFTHRHFLMSSTSVKCTLVINWTNVCIVLYCCVQYVKIYTRQRAFADSIIIIYLFFISFEENCCWIIVITSRSLWQPFFIAGYVVSANHFGRKIILFVWWNQRNMVYYELNRGRQLILKINQF